MSAQSFYDFEGATTEGQYFYDHYQESYTIPSTTDNKYHEETPQVVPTDQTQLVQEIRYSFVVYLIPPLSKVADKEISQSQSIPDCQITQLKLKFTDIPASLYNAINIDREKSVQYRENLKSNGTHFIKSVCIQLQQPTQTLENSRYEEYVQQILELIEGSRDKVEFNKKNQFDFIYLCDLFQLQAVKHSLMNYISQNVDLNNVFEFLRIASQEPDNKESMRESYWIIVFIYLRKIAWDISESFDHEKTRQMLHSVNPYDFSFSNGFLVHETSQKKIDLSIFVPIALEEQVAKNQYIGFNNMHNLTKVNRSKSEQGLLSDYPHFYSLKMEGKEKIALHGRRQSENGEFQISIHEKDFTLYGRNHLCTVVPNFLGTRFEVYNFGLEPGYLLNKDIPKDLLPIRQRLGSIEYDSNFFAEKPRSFRVTVTDETGADRFHENLSPKFNEQRGCYTLNFYGRVSKASARNFQLIETDGDEEEIILSHGKNHSNEFNLDFRAPFSQVTAFAVSLSAIGKKRVVG